MTQWDYHALSWMICLKVTLIKIRGGASEIAKSLLAISVMAILVAGIVAPALQEAHAYPQKAQFSAEKLKAKSFGVKTKDKIPFDDNTKHNGFGAIKSEQIKTYKKTVAAYSAKQVLKNLYNLG